MGKLKDLERDDLVPDSNKLKDYHPIDNAALETAVSGATWGLYPRARAALETGTLGWETLGASPEQSDAYTQRKRELEGRLARYRQHKPWEAMGLDMAGAAMNPLNYVGPLGGTRVAMANRAGHVITPGSKLSVKGRLGRAGGFTDEVGGVGSESLAMSAKQGGAYGFGASPEEDLGYRFVDAASGAATGAVLGGATGKAVQGAQRLLRGPMNTVGEALQSGKENRIGSTSAMLRMNKELENAGHTATDIAENVFPDTILGNTARMKQQGRRLRQAMMSSDDPVGTYVQLTRQAGINTSEKTLAGHVTKAQKSFKSQIPLTLDEVATSQRMAGPDGNISYGKGLIDTRRAVAQTPGEHVDQMQDFVLNRQRNVLAHTRNKIDDLSGTADDIDTLTEQTKQLTDDMYDEAYLAEEPFDISDILSDFWDQETWRGGKAEAAIKDIMKTFGVDPDTGLSNPLTLQKFQDQRQKLNEAIQDSMRVTPQGKEATSATRELTRFKEAIDERVGSKNPVWKEANDIARNGFAIKEAYNSGRRISIAGGGRTSAIMKDIKGLNSRISTTAAKIKKLQSKQNKGPGLEDKEEVLLRRLQNTLQFMKNELAGYRQGAAEVLREQIGKTGDMHDPAKYFHKGLGTDSGPRALLKQIFGEDKAKEFMDQIDDVGRVGQTTRQYGGSQTFELLAKDKELSMDDAINAAADMATVNPGGLIRQAGRKAAEVYAGNRNRHLGDMFTTSTHDLPGFMRTLGNLDQYKQQSTGRKADFLEDNLGTLGKGALESAYFGAPGYLGTAKTRAEIDEMNRWDRLYRDRDREEELLPDILESLGIGGQ